MEDLLPAVVAAGVRVEPFATMPAERITLTDAEIIAVIAHRQRWLQVTPPL